MFTSISTWMQIWITPTNIMSKENNPIYRQEIKAYIESTNLADTRRIQTSNSARYTWHSRGKSARLDCIFEHLQNNINQILIKI